MRILVVHNYYQHKGGEDVVFHQEVEALKKDHHVETITFQNKKGIEGLIQFVLYPWNIFAANKILQKAREFSADIIHIHNLHYALGPLAIRKLHQAGFKTVQTLHNFRLICPSAKLLLDNKIFTDSIKEDFPWTAIKNKALDNSLLKTFLTGFTYWLHKKIGTWASVSRFIVLTNFNRQLFIKANLNILSSKFKVKENFVEFDISPQTTREDYYLFVGRLSYEKGVEQLISAFLNNSKKLKLIGTGPLSETIKHRISNSLNITLLGELPKEEVYYYLTRCKALIIPSICYEGGVPLTIKEGIATKTPILASNVGSIPELVIPDVTGWLFDPYVSKNIQDTIQNFENSDLRIDIVEQAYQKFLDTFTKERTIAKLEHIYQEVLDEN